MVPEALTKSRTGKFFLKLLAAGFESRFRYRFFGPAKILRGADILPAQSVFEVGCGTGYFTIPTAHLIGDDGCLVAMDIIPEAIELVSKKVQAASLKNVRLIIGNAMNTGLDAESFDVVLLFGVIPAPMLPLSRLLPEMHRLLKAEGNLAVWPPVPGWLPQAILPSGLFLYAGKRHGVHNFRRLDSRF